MARIFLGEGAGGAVTVPGPGGLDLWHVGLHGFGLFRAKHLSPCRRADKGDEPLDGHDVLLQLGHQGLGGGLLSAVLSWQSAVLGLLSLASAQQEGA